MANTHFVKISTNLLYIIPQGGTPTAEQWQERLDSNRTYINELKAAGYTEARRLIVSVDGSALSMHQRKELDSLYHDAGMPCLTALMTASSAVRAVFLVVRWVTDNSVRMFGIDDMSSAAKFLKMNAGEVFAARQEMAKMGLGIKKGIPQPASASKETRL